MLITVGKVITSFFKWRREGLHEMENNQKKNPKNYVKGLYHKMDLAFDDMYG